MIGNQLFATKSADVTRCGTLRFQRRSFEGQRIEDGGGELFTFLHSLSENTCLIAAPWNNHTSLLWAFAQLWGRLGLFNATADVCGTVESRSHLLEPVSVMLCAK